MTKALIFDMDGVIIDSEPLWKKAIIEVMRHYGYEFDIEMCNRTKGMRIDEVTLFWKKELNSDFDSLIVANEIIEELIVMINREGEIMPGILKTIESATNKNLKIALASSSSLKIIESVLNKLSIKKYFEVIKSAENEEYGKPHPQVFISTAKKLNVLPEECMVIEDSINGVIAAKAAKMTVIAVPEKEEIHLPQFSIADKVLENLTQLTF